MGKRRTLLNEVIGQKVEGVVLRKNRGLIVNRAVLEVEHKFTGYFIAFDLLNQVTRGDRLPRNGAKHKQSMRDALSVAHCNRVSS